MSEVVVADAVDVGGYLDLRDEGYGFLRVNGYLPSKERRLHPGQAGRASTACARATTSPARSARPAATRRTRALLEIVHGQRRRSGAGHERRPNFEDLTALFPDQRLTLEDPSDPTNMTARIIDLVSPIGKGQRGIIVSPPKAGKTTIMKTIAKSIELNNPEVDLIVLLVDERPEEVTDMRRTVKGEVIAVDVRPAERRAHPRRRDGDRAGASAWSRRARTSSSCSTASPA